MHYVLYVPGMSFNGATLSRGQSLGGSESAGYYLARELARRGHQVTVFSPIAPGDAGRWEDVDYRPIGASTQSAPFGEIFEAFAAQVPHDVLIGQRAPGLFQHPTASKVNLWWTHDLALKRNMPAMGRQLWNINAVLCVSEFHKAQVGEVYGLKPERMVVVPNGVDSAVFPDSVDAEAKRRGKMLVYSSRPERGLEHLLGSGDPAHPGIMERLAEADPEIVLKVCGYDNTAPEMAGYYAGLAERCRVLPNVEFLGALSKPKLARLMSEAFLHVYPTTFEEVSCITAMETQCAGTPIVTTPVAALPETLRDAGVVWVPLAGGEDDRGDENPEGSPNGTLDRLVDHTTGRTVDREAFAHTILTLQGDPERYGRLHDIALSKAEDFGWGRAADAVEDTVAETLARGCAEPGRMARHWMRMSDIHALREHLAAQKEQPGTPHESPGNSKENPDDPAMMSTAKGGLVAATLAELDSCYRFAAEEDFAGHYAAYYAYEAERGVVYGPEDLAGNPRFESVGALVAALPEGAAVLDYGCAHGHYTVNLARRFPHLRFIGVDLVADNIDKARAWAADQGLDNVEFHVSHLDNEKEGLPSSLPGFDLVLAAEVLEHVNDPAALADALATHLTPDGRMVITTPYGPWEAQGYAEHHPWRAHLHHLESADLEDLFGRHPAFALQAIPAGATNRSEPLGSFLVTFRKPTSPSGRINLARKAGAQAPRETLSVCMIVSPDGDTMARCLESVASIADEIILGIDGGDEGEVLPGHAWALAETFGARVANLTAFPIVSPRAQGFDAARNATLDRASGDWILWIDDDEELLWPERLPKYLRDNGYDAYAVKQHHFAVEPGGVIKTDLPCRLFRNRRGFRFFGHVHEHPELGLNEGAGQVLLLPDIAICHNGYVTEDVRRSRFERNLPLMRRDRAANPDRLLGRFLWIRDLAHLNRFEFEQGGRITARMRAQAGEAIDLWRGLIDEGQVRMAVDALPYYSEATDMLAGEGSGGGIECQVAIGLAFQGIGDPPDQPTTLQGRFLHTGDIEKLTLALLQEKSANISGRYL